MFESFGKSYIILPSQKLLTFETWFWRQQLFRIKKQTEKKLVFIIECVTHPENYTSSCYLGKLCFLRLDSEDNSCLEFEKSNLKKFTCHHAISEIIELWHLIMKNKNVWNQNTTESFLSSSQCVWVIQKKLHQLEILETIDFWDLVIKTKFDYNQKKL